MEYPWKKSQLVLIMVFFLLQGIGSAGVITRLPIKDKVIAITFDACETKTASYFDKSILDWMIKNQIPCTIFVGGKFARRNATDLAGLSQYSFIEIENHSMNHPQHMETLKVEEAKREVIDCENTLHEIVGRRPIFFRFPAGNYNEGTLRAVEALGYRVVHWTFPSGDPDKKTTANKLTQWVLGKAAPGAILIFHINGRGYHTGEALPEIIGQLRKSGYRFARLDEVLPPTGEEGSRR